MSNREPPRTGRVAAVTGATGAIGKAIAEGIAALPGYQVILLVRNPAAASLAVSDIKRATGNPAVRYELVDVSRRQSIVALAARWSGPLHVLVNNAAVTPPRREETPEGIELQFATNVLGYFWLTQLLAAVMQRSAPSRIVNVASYWAGGLEVSDLEFKRRPYTNGAAYRQSKQANRMLSVAFANKLRPLGITVNACHPDDVGSKLSNNLGFGGHETPWQGAKTPVWLATDPSIGERTGEYYEHLHRVRCTFSGDQGAVEALFQACQGYDNAQTSRSVTDFRPL